MKNWARRFRTAVLTSFIICQHHSVAEGRNKLSVGVIGAGIGGSTSSYFLRELLGSEAEIVVFEKAANPGGRTQHIFHQGKPLETGASIIYSGNQHLFNLTERVNLKRVDDSRREGPNTGLWDGERFVLVTSDWDLANVVKMLWRYGMPLLSMRSMVKDALEKFDRIYALQAAGRVFDTPEDLWGEVGLLDLTRKTIAEHFERKVGRADSLVEDELAYASNRVNYNQGNALNALAGVVSLCPAVTGDLFKVEGGNSRLSEELLRASAAEVRLHTKVTHITGSSSGGYSLHTGGGVEKLGTFDAVVIATPMSLAGITLDIRDQDGNSEDFRKPVPTFDYQEVHTTFIRGIVDRTYFGLDSSSTVPASVLLTEAADHLPFSSLSLQSWDGNPSNEVGVYKLFSRRQLWTGALDSLFVKGSWEILHHKDWRAYPVLSPKETFTPAHIFPGHPVWYVSSLEEGVSAMEISAIAAKNAALGIAKALLDKDHDVHRQCHEASDANDGSGACCDVGGSV